jgi:hypothetical protein
MVCDGIRCLRTENLDTAPLGRSSPQALSSSPSSKNVGAFEAGSSTTSDMEVCAQRPGHRHTRRGPSRADVRGKSSG